jgi:hypothetical protein
MVKGPESLSQETLNLFSKLHAIRLSPIRSNQYCDISLHVLHMFPFMLPGSMFQGLIDYYFTGSMMHGILNPYLLFTAPLFLYSSTPLAKKIASEKIPNISKKFNLWWAARSSKLQQVGNQELLNVLNSLSEWIIKSRGLREIVIIDRCPALTEEEIKLYLESLKQASKVDILVNLAIIGADKKD